jgi:hypothetical protein
MSEPRGVFRPTTCTSCKAIFYTDTAWDAGQLVKLSTICRECDVQGSLFGDET